MAGRLIYLMGPSGSGKDTVLQGLSRLMGHGVWLVPRFITRPVTDTERGAVSVSEAAFLHLERSGALAMSWRANGLAYGVPVELNQRLAEGCDVLVNGSREYLPQARRRYPGLVPVLLTVSDQALYQRLLQRGRERPAEIRGRLARNARYLALRSSFRDEALMVLDNSGPVEAAVQTLYQYLIQTTGELSQHHDSDIARNG